MAIDNIQTDLRFLPNDEWALDNFTATFAGARIELSGTVTNASAVRDWRFFQGRQPAPAEVWQNRLRQLADTLEGIHFSTPPELALDVRGDARDPLSFTVRMRASAPRADTPWGTLTRGHATLGLYPPSTNRILPRRIEPGRGRSANPVGQDEACAAHRPPRLGRRPESTWQMVISH